ncbi:glycoside hydrolase family 16 protein [Thalassotalea atypica]|uniref:glycoside hydrolase family 16 protein n=1 Tax=Thalassotalea atypica TaxID=2054316 RepID=UPI0025744E69|nr:glycoside hydrolase family 16 protein [Thalassotalea atypica]
MKTLIGLLPIIFVIGGCAGSEKSALQVSMNLEQRKGDSGDNTAPSVSEHWQLVWSDEFDSAALDSEKWSVENNCFGGGNNERQCYTTRLDNAFIENDKLVITAIEEDYRGPASHDDAPDYNVNITKTQPYTSARLRTLHKGEWQYGRFEIKAKLPHGQGTWPAIWMLPSHWFFGGWAGSGEIDIMEAVNLGAKSDLPDALSTGTETRVHGTLHYGRKYPDNIYSGTYYLLEDNQNPADDFHVYAIEWEQDEIRWYVDGIHYATQNKQGWYTQYLNEQGDWINGGQHAPFDQKFHLLINFAVGGAWPESVNEKGIDNSVFPQRFEIDYVRVYQCSLSPTTGEGCATVGNSPKLVRGHSRPAL